MKHFFIIFIVCVSLTSCGSFGAGMLDALSGYNPYGYANSSYYTFGSTPLYSSGTSYSSTSSSTRTTNTSSSSSGSQDCPSLKVGAGKWFCANTGKCGMCGGDGKMDGSFGSGPNSLNCTLCSGSGKCKYCR